LDIANISFITNQWVGYDDAETFIEKVGLVQKIGLGGISIWAMYAESATGSILQNAIHTALFSNNTNDNNNAAASTSTSTETNSGSSITTSKAILFGSITTSTILSSITTNTLFGSMSSINTARSSSSFNLFFVIVTALCFFLF